MSSELLYLQTLRHCTNAAIIILLQYRHFVVGRYLWVCWLCRCLWALSAAY